MKSRALLTLFLLLLAARSYGAKKEENERVVDIRSEPLQTDSAYNILPVDRGQGGGIYMARGRNNSRLIDVIQQKDGQADDLQISFTLVSNQTGVLRVQTGINIRFTTENWPSGGPFNTGGKPLFWLIRPVDKTTKQSFVGTGRSPMNAAGSFQIVNNGFFYNLRYCPVGCKTCLVVCRPIGIYNDNGLKRLALSDVPFKIMFT